MFSRGPELGCFLGIEISNVWERKLSINLLLDLHTVTCNWKYLVELLTIEFLLINLSDFTVLFYYQNDSVELLSVSQLFQMVFFFLNTEFECSPDNCIDLFVKFFQFVTNCKSEIETLSVV